MWRRGGGADKKYDYTAQTGEQHTSVSLYLSLSLSVCVNMVYICICVCGYSRGARTSERMTENMTTSAKKRKCCNKTRNKRQFHWAARVRLGRGEKGGVNVEGVLQGSQWV